MFSCRVSMLNSTACQPSCVIFELCFAHFVFGSVMATVERPEVEIVSGEAPAAAAAGEVNEIPVPSPKASGPAGPPAAPSTVVGGGEPNLTGNTVSGPLMVDVDLLEVPLDNLLALSMGSVEPSDDLVSTTCFEVSKAEAERWHRAAHDAQEMVFAMQSEMDRVVRIHSENPGTELDETRLPDDSGPRSGMSYRELGIRRHAMVIRQQQLRAGARFWAFAYFQGLVQPETSDLAPMSSLPESARGTALASADYLHDLLRWSIGRFSKLSDLYAHMSDYMAQLQETDNSSKKQFNELGEKIHELSNGIIGLSSSIRHTQEEQLKAARSSAKSLTDVQWQLSGVGKSVNTSTKESLLSMGKVLSQLGTSVEKQGKSMDKTNLLLENLCSTMKTLVDVEEKKSKLVAQVSQSAKAAPMTGTTSTPVSVPGVSPLPLPVVLRPLRRQVERPKPHLAQGR